MEEGAGKAVKSDKSVCAAPQEESECFSREDMGGRVVSGLLEWIYSQFLTVEMSTDVRRGQLTSPKTNI